MSSEVGDVNREWARALFADDSSEMLLIWADWLEDQSDPACQGVREYLVPMHKRPEWRRDPFPENKRDNSHYAWWNWSDESPHNLPLELWQRLSAPTTEHQLGKRYWGERTSAHYRALYDAARAWLKTQTDT